MSSGHSISDSPVLFQTCPPSIQVYSVAQTKITPSYVHLLSRMCFIYSSLGLKYIMCVYFSMCSW